MGGTIIDMEIKKRSEKLMRKEFAMIQGYERQTYGTDPYAGTWGNVDKVRVVSYKPVSRWTKKAKREAMDYLYCKVVKWEEAEAIKTNDSYLICAFVAT